MHYSRFPNVDRRHIAQISVVLFAEVNSTFLSSNESKEEESKLGFDLWQTYSVNEESLSVSIGYGHWQPGAVLTPALQNLIEQRTDLLGTTLSCISEPEYYAVYLNMSSDGKPSFTGWIPDLIEHLQKFMNFT
ncbi:hypothetical protein FHG87_005356 [Trinorchestia longiramus]|nr:hypothetical protein FHG87_005356 [Trinorchestia longiramus]